MSYTIAAIIKNLLDELDISHDSIEIIDDALGTVFMVRTGEARLLIGVNGSHLIALNHLVKRIAEKKSTAEKFGFSVDVNDYQKQRNEELKNKACIIADRVKSFRSHIEMEPMTPYERMLVHEALKDTSGVYTKSTGSGRERRVVVKYSETGTL